MKTVWAVVPVIAVVGIYGLNRPTLERKLEVVGGRSTISFFPSILQSGGLRLKADPSAEGDPFSMEVSSGYKIAKSDLKFTLIDGRLTGFDGGQLEHKGGFTLSGGRGNLSVQGFRITPSRTLTDGLQLTVGSGANAFTAFELRHPRGIYTPSTHTLTVAHMDVVLTVAAAQRLGKPDLAGNLVGMLTVYAESEPIDGQGEVEIPETNRDGGGDDAPLDVAISNMSTLTSLARVGTFPNGRNGLSMSTTSCNVGTSNIPWFAPMNENHPVIAMQLYRVKDGEFEQVGWSWLKHGFLATNSPNCGTCQNPGTGTMLGPNCSDTYGTGNNGDRFYLGARDEVNPFTGKWTCMGSWFSNFQPDCVRRNPATPSGLDSVDHRLDVLDVDLGNANSQYYYEAYYISLNDFDKYNNIASRQASMTWNAGNNRWDISTIDGGQTQGPAINRWGELRNFATPRTEGDVIVAVQTTNLGGGNWRYSYAVYNHDLDRRIREFSVPIPSGANPTNVRFRDIDRDPNNEWAFGVAGGKVTWSTGTHGSSGANPLKYASVFNFRFECNVPPMGGSAILGLSKPGTGTELTGATKVPLNLTPFASYQVFNGIEFGGNLASLEAPDDNRLEIGPTNDGSRSGTGITTSMTGPSGAVTSMTVGCESKNTLTAGGTQTLHLWNFQTSNWELVDTRPTTVGDTIAVVTISSAADRFIDASTREVRAKVTHTGLGESGNRWRMSIDQLGMKFN